MVITGDADEDINLDGVRRLVELAKESKELVVVKGADHALTDPNAYEATMDQAVSWFHSQRPEWDRTLQ